MKHTQDKWKVESAGKILAIATGEQLIATIENKNTDSEEAEANAKLIASAPEMLQKLVDIKNWLRRNEQNREQSAVAESIEYLIKQATE